VGVVREAAIAAALVAVMVLVFIGSASSMLIVIASIPAVRFLTSIACLHLCGKTINTMTLGGIALAVGMLVDDATVEIGEHPSAITR